MKLIRGLIDINNLPMETVGYYNRNLSDGMIRGYCSSCNWDEDVIYDYKNIDHGRLSKALSYINDNILQTT